MSTGKRLAKRSIIGTRVCAPGKDGMYYSGVIHAVKTPASMASEPGLSITPKTRYSVRFDAVLGGRPPNPSTEYSDCDLIGPGFGSVTGAKLVAGQKVYLTFNGREIHAEVTEHRDNLDEVDVVIAPTGQEVCAQSLFIAVKLVCPIMWHRVRRIPQTVRHALLLLPSANDSTSRAVATE